MSKELSIEDVRADFNKITKFSLTPDPNVFSKYPKGYILDENQSVKWNIEEVNRQNELYRLEKERLRDVYHEVENAAHATARTYIIQETQMNPKQASILWNFVYDKYHSYIGDLLDNLDEYIDLMVRIFDCKDYK